MNSNPTAANSTNRPISPGDSPDHRMSDGSHHPTHQPPPNTAVTRYCGMASSHHLTSTNPRDKRSGYCTVSSAG